MEKLRKKVTKGLSAVWKRSMCWGRRPCDVASRVVTSQRRDVTGARRPAAPDRRPRWDCPADSAAGEYTGFCAPPSRGLRAISIARCQQEIQQTQYTLGKQTITQTRLTVAEKLRSIPKYWPIPLLVARRPRGGSDVAEAHYVTGHHHRYR